MREGGGREKCGVVVYAPSYPDFILRGWERGQRTEKRDARIGAIQPWCCRTGARAMIEDPVMQESGEPANVEREIPISAAFRWSGNGWRCLASIEFLRRTSRGAAFALRVRRRGFDVFINCCEICHLLFLRTFLFLSSCAEKNILATRKMVRKKIEQQFCPVTALKIYPLRWKSRYIFDIIILHMHGICWGDIVLLTYNMYISQICVNILFRNLCILYIIYGYCVHIKILAYVIRAKSISHKIFDHKGLINARKRMLAVKHAAPDENEHFSHCCFAFACVYERKGRASWQQCCKENEGTYKEATRCRKGEEAQEGRRVGWISEIFLTRKFREFVAAACREFFVEIYGFSTKSRSGFVRGEI